MSADVAETGLVERGRSLLVVIDAQERLMPAIVGGEAALGRIGLLVSAAARLGVPVVATEQHPAGLGPTVPALAARLRGLDPPARIVPKLHFCAWAEPAVRDAVAAAGRDQAVLCGFEAHVCVLQSALAMRADGRPVFVVADAVGSRDPASRSAALDRLARAGVVPVTAEMVVFEWLAHAATTEFRDLLGEIK